MSDAKEKYNAEDVGLALGMSAKKVRAYVRLGIFPRPIRDYGLDEGGFWLPEDLEVMKKRRLMMHRYVVPKPLRELIDELLPTEASRKRKRRKAEGESNGRQSREKSD